MYNQLMSFVFFKFNNCYNYSLVSEVAKINDRAGGLMPLFYNFLILFWMNYEKR